MGANEAAIARRIPQYFSAWTAVSRELPTPLPWPETMTSKPPFMSAPSPNSRSPFTIRPA